MNNVLSALFFGIVLYGGYFTLLAQPNSRSSVGIQDLAGRCRPNPDPRYLRSRVLEEFADMLNNSIPEYSEGGNRGFYSHNERGVGFFVVDLTDPINKDLAMQDCVNFLNGHVYHVAPSDSHYSLSHIVILEEGNLKVFRSVNCPSRGDRLEDVIKYVTAKLSDDKQRDEIIDRVRNYRKFGFYGSLHHAASICKDRK